MKKEDKSFVPIRLSLGVAIAGRFEELKIAIDNADKNMYIQKRNRKGI